MRYFLLKFFRILFSIVLSIAVGAIIISTGVSGGGCFDEDQSEIEELPMDDQTYHDKIVEAAQKRINFTVNWTNRDGVRTEDGNTFHNHGVGYGKVSYGVEDDMDEFKLGLTGQHFPGMYWSDYGCAPEPEDKKPGGDYRPGRRNYAQVNCIPYEGTNPCSAVDIDYMGGVGNDCRWWWTGAQCFSFVAFVLKEVDPTRYDGLDMSNLECLALKHYILSNGLGYECDRSLAVYGDLVFMNIEGSIGPPADHVGIISHQGYYQEDDCTNGTFGFYGSPFYYKAAEASNQDIDEVLHEEWNWHCVNYGWGLQYNNLNYVHLTAN